MIETWEGVLRGPWNLTPWPDDPITERERPPPGVVWYRELHEDGRIWLRMTVDSDGNRNAWVLS